jgi:hypothetical protein
MLKPPFTGPPTSAHDTVREVKSRTENGTTTIYEHAVGRNCKDAAHAYSITEINLPSNGVAHGAAFSAQCSFTEMLLPDRGLGTGDP